MKRGKVNSEAQLMKYGDMDEDDQSQSSDGTITSELKEQTPKR